MSVPTSLRLVEAIIARVPRVAFAMPASGFVVHTHTVAVVAVLACPVPRSGVKPLLALSSCDTSKKKLTETKLRFDHGL